MSGPKMAFLRETQLKWAKGRNITGLYLVISYILTVRKDWGYLED